MDAALKEVDDESGAGGSVTKERTIVNSDRKLPSSKISNRRVLHRGVLGWY